MVTAAGLAAARAVAAAVPDPELPMLTVADLGILRGVATEGERLVVTITPTYSGCPALREIAHDLRRRLAASGFAEVDVRTALAPAWSTLPSGKAFTGPSALPCLPPGLPPVAAPCTRCQTDIIACELARSGFGKMLESGTLPTSLTLCFRSSWLVGSLK